MPKTRLNHTNIYSLCPSWILLWVHGLKSLENNSLYSLPHHSLSSYTHAHAHTQRSVPKELPQSSANLASSISAACKRLGGQQTVQTLNRSNINLHLCHTVAGPRHTSTKYSRIIPLHQTETWWHQCRARMKDGGPIRTEGCQMWKDSSVNRRQTDLEFKRWW